MEYIKFGNTGMDISRICLGTMSFGDPHNWVLEEESRKIIKYALDSGINFFDIANIYSNGVSEKIMGKALRDYGNRDELVVATKVYFSSSKKPNQQGLSRKARYIDASVMYAWQFQKAKYIAEKYEWTKIVSMQNHMNLIYREEEREMMPLCEDMNIAVTPYSPLAAGRLARASGIETKRSTTDEVAVMKYGDTEERDQDIIDRVSTLAERYKVAKAQIALAWLLQKKNVAAPIIGATKTKYIDDAVKALDVKLSEEDINFLEETYIPHKVVGALYK